jgi:hypothetical protein
LRIRKPNAARPQIKASGTSTMMSQRGGIYPSGMLNVTTLVPAKGVPASAPTYVA